MFSSRRFLWVGIVCLLAPAPALAAPDFETQVLPVLTKAGCNSGACHGAAIGRGGFRLSLLGYDPASDYENMVHELAGRRVHLVKPEKSLLLRKPSLEVAHEGDRRLAKDGDGYRIVLEWIKAGAQRGPGRSLKSVSVEPSVKTLTATGESFTMKVSARFSDGATEDVTAWSVYTPIDTAALRVNAVGEVTALRRGQSGVMVRFLGEVGCVTVTVPLTDDKTLRDRPRANFIDEYVNRTLDQLRLPHSPRADDRTLVRRLYLDLIGTLPEPKEVEAYVSDTAADKYGKLVVKLLARPEHVDHWAYKWGDLLRVDPKRLDPKGAAAYHEWVREQVTKNTPLDRMARELLLATGDTHKVGAANFSRVPGDAGTQAEYVSQVFLGVRLQCANCHNHPLDRWTQDDYHGLAAVFAKLKRGQEIGFKPEGEVIHPRTGKAALPRLPGLEFIDGKADPREKLAMWVTSKENTYFSKTATNRLWRELMGRGLVEPIDDHRATNPATHPELLDALAKDFVTNGFDVKHVLRTIVASEAYRRSATATGANKTDDRFYSRGIVRTLPAPVLVDAVSRVTGVAEPLGRSAISLPDSRVASIPLDLLGRCSRDAGCTPTGVSSGSLPLALHKIYGPWLNDKVAAPQGRLHQLLKGKSTDAEIVTVLYEQALGRAPSAAELAHWQKKLAADDAAERTRRFEDFFWALLNLPEFTCNH